MKRLLIALSALALLGTACGGGSDSSDTTPPPTSTTPTTQPPSTQPPTGNEDGVVLQLNYEGGFAPIEFVINRTPAITLFADGRILTEGPTVAIFPGPALPNIQQSIVSDETMADIMELIEIIGLPDITELRNTDANCCVADATDTVVRYFDDNGEHLISVYALGIGALQNEPGRQVPDEVLNLGLLVDLLNTAAFEGNSVPYEPTALQLVLLSPDQGFVDPQFANTIEWPFGDLTIEGFASNGFISCATVDGDDVGPAMEAMAEANSVTTYLLDGEEHRILVRPLIPGETPCAMLAN